MSTQSIDANICKRVYEKLRNKSLMTPDEQKLAESIESLRKSQKDELERRKCSIFIKDYNDAPPEDNTRFNTVAAPAKRHQQVVKPPKPEANTCKATKMDGNTCTAKAKPGCEFCGRHNKKAFTS